MKVSSVEMVQLWVLLVFYLASCSTATPAKSRELAHCLQMKIKEIQGQVKNIFQNQSSEEAEEHKELPDFRHIQSEMHYIQKTLNESFQSEKTASVIMSFTGIDTCIKNNCNNLIENNRNAYEMKKMGAKAFAEYILNFVNHLPLECPNLSTPK